MPAKMAAALVALESPPDGAFQAIYNRLHQASVEVLGPIHPRFLVVPLRDEAGAVVGGLWGSTMLTWMQLEMLFVPQAMRGQGYGSALVTTAEAEAKARGCQDVLVDTFSFQAAPFYEKHGYTRFAALDDLPPGHQRIYYRKRLGGRP